MNSNVFKFNNYFLVFYIMYYVGFNKLGFTKSLGFRGGFIKGFHVNPVNTPDYIIWPRQATVGGRTKAVEESDGALLNNRLRSLRFESRVAEPRSLSPPYPHFRGFTNSTISVGNVFDVFVCSVYRSASFLWRIRSASSRAFRVSHTVYEAIRCPDGRG